MMVSPTQPAARAIERNGYPPNSAARLVCDEGGAGADHSSSHVRGEAAPVPRKCSSEHFRQVFTEITELGDSDKPIERHSPGECGLSLLMERKVAGGEEDEDGDPKSRSNNRPGTASMISAARAMRPISPPSSWASCTRLPTSLIFLSSGACRATFALSHRRTFFSSRAGLRGIQLFVELRASCTSGARALRSVSEPARPGAIRSG